MKNTKKETQLSTECLEKKKSKGIDRASDTSTNFQGDEPCAMISLRFESLRLR
jgi:hypothetical protein